MPITPKSWLYILCMLPSSYLMAQEPAKQPPQQPGQQPLQQTGQQPKPAPADSAASSPFHKILTEVTITGKGPTLRNGPEKKVFSVNQSLVSLGGSAADLLQNVPTLQIDGSGNISLRGATNIKVLVDGRRSLIGGGSVAELLQSLPAGSIDRVEIITSPSAKYDAEGQAIINIILKKNNTPGFNNSVSVTGGTRDNYVADASINYQKEKLNFYSNYGYLHRNTYSNGYQDMTYLLTPDNTRFSNETFPSTTIRNIQTAKAGIDYRLTSRDFVSVGVLYSTTTKSRNEFLTVNNLTATQSPAQLIHQENTTSAHGHTYELTLDWTHTFKPHEEISFDFDFTPGVTDNTQLYDQNIYNLNGQQVDSNSLLRDHKQENDRNYNIQLDYTLPLGKTGTLETGVRSQIIVTDNHQWDDNLDETAKQWIPDYTLINSFSSTNQVYAAYVNYRQQLKTVTLQLGVRAELGQFDGHLHSFDSTGDPLATPVSVNTRGLYPSLQVIKKLDEGRQFQFNYTRRINRPTADELNPFFDVSDPVNYNAGNLHLLPEEINSVELTYTRSWPNASLTSGLYFSQAHNVIKHIQTNPVTDVTYTIAENIKSSINTGIELIGNFHPVQAWSLTANFNGYERINAAAPLYGIAATQGFSWNVNLTNNFTIARNLTLQVRTDYTAADLRIQDRYRPAYGIDLGARYVFWHNKASLALNGRDIFDTRKWRFLRVSDQLLLNFQRVTYADRVAITFTYHFGKGTFDTFKRKKVEDQEGKRIESR